MKRTHTHTHTVLIYFLLVIVVYPPKRIIFKLLHKFLKTVIRRPIIELSSHFLPHSSLSLSLCLVSWLYIFSSLFGVCVVQGFTRSVVSYLLLLVGWFCLLCGILFARLSTLCVVLFLWCDGLLNGITLTNSGKTHKYTHSLAFSLFNAPSVYEKQMTKKNCFAIIFCVSAILTARTKLTESNKRKNKTTNSQIFLLFLLVVPSHSLDDCSLQIFYIYIYIDYLFRLYIRFEFIMCVFFLYCRIEY